ncbi:hypothetical protein [Streptomyces telluris]|uniref:Proteinase inhibitor I42 chagasin domain-containing protein n=1 Tax=Streptomyces telluris TaxID=2720021 RepID=A0A9X2RPF8_9ACTN|nr:hypothetical protein [Streptomyces telluris]MCQ8771060.1 hypothetical protein [Streptomyces telluris]
MLGRTLLALTALTTALVIPSAAPDADAAVLATTSLTNTSHGRTLNLPTGDQISVRLRPIQGNGEKWTWSTPVVSSADVLTRTEGHETPDGGATADIRVDGPGQSDITAQRTCTSTRPQHRCRHLTFQWRVTVNAH